LDRYEALEFYANKNDIFSEKFFFFIFFFIFKIALVTWDGGADFYSGLISMNFESLTIDGDPSQKKLQNIKRS